MKPYAQRNPNYPTGSSVKHQITRQPCPKSKPIKQDQPKPQQVSIKQIFHYLNIWNCEAKKKYDYVQQFQQYLLQKRDSIAMEEVQRKLSKPDFVRFFKYLKERDDSAGDEIIDNDATINIAYTAKERREQNAIKSNKKLQFPMVKESQLLLPTSFDPHKVIPTPSPDDFLIVSHQFKQCIEFEGQQQVAKDTLLAILLGSRKFCEAYELNKYLIEEQIRHYPTSDDEYFTQDEFINFILYPKLTVIKVNTNEPAAELAISVLFSEQQMGIVDQVFTDLNHDGLNYVDICRLVGSLRSRYETQSVLFLDFLQVGHMKYSLEKWVYQFEIWCICNGVDAISSHRLTEMYTKHMSIPNKSIVMASQSLSKSKTHLKLYENDNSILPLSFFADLEQIILHPQTLAYQIVDDILCNDAFMLKYRKHLVRKQATNQLPIETVEATLDRIKIESTQYLDLDDLIDFFTIRGRPLGLSQILKKTSNNISNTPPKQTNTDTAKFGAINNINQQFLITIPNPKYDEPTKPKSLRQKQIEKMLLDNEKGVKKELDYKFKAHPVPWYVTEPLYDKMNREREESRQKRKDESKAKLMESMMNPKSFEKLPNRPVLREDNEEFQFKSRPIPNHTNDPLFEQIQQQQKDRSKQNVERRKQEWEEYFAEFDMTKQTQDRLDEISMRHRRRSHSPLQHKMFRAKDMPDFEHLHEKFESEMANKKAIFQPTVPMESVLSKQSTMIDCTMLDYENIGKSSAQDRIGNIDYRLQQVLNRPKPTILCTKKSRSISTLRKKQKYEKWHHQQTEQEYVEQMKKERQALLPTNMRVSNPAAKQQKLLDKELSDLVKWKKTYHRNLDKDYEKQLKKMNKKVRKKPLLMYGKEDQDYSSSSGGKSSRTDISDRKQAAYDYNYY